QNGLVRSFGTGIGREPLLQSLSAVPSEPPRCSDTRARMLARESDVKRHSGRGSRLVRVRDRPFELDPERVPFTDGLVVAGEGIGALVVEAHPLEGDSREHPEPRQIQTESDSDQRPSGLHSAVSLCLRPHTTDRRRLTPHQSSQNAKSDSGKQAACHIRRRGISSISCAETAGQTGIQPWSAGRRLPDASGEKSPRLCSSWPCYSRSEFTL